jgi:hypothetical protein
MCSQHSIQVSGVRYGLSSVKERGISPLNTQPSTLAFLASTSPKLKVNLTPCVAMSMGKISRIYDLSNIKFSVDRLKMSEREALGGVNDLQTYEPSVRVKVKIDAFSDFLSASDIFFLNSDVESIHFFVILNLHL